MFHVFSLVCFLLYGVKEEVRRWRKDEFWSNLARFEFKIRFFTKFLNDSAWFLLEKLKKHVILTKNHNIWPKIQKIQLPHEFQIFIPRRQPTKTLLLTLCWRPMWRPSIGSGPAPWPQGAPYLGPFRGFDLVSGYKLCQRVQPLAAGPNIANIKDSKYD